MASNDSMEVSTFVEYGSDAELAAVELFYGYPDSLLWFAFASCVIFMVIGIPGNLITMIALASCKKFWNATAIFIINLQICNLIFCCIILPMTAVTFLAKHWIFGKTMCAVYPLMKYALNATTHFTVVAITINRCIIVCHPHIYSRLYKKKSLIITLIGIWLVAFTLFLPSFFGVWGRFDLEPLGGFCTMLSDRNNICPKKLFLTLAFVGPYLIITICYGRIWWIVRKSTRKIIINQVYFTQPSLCSNASSPSIVEKGLNSQEPTTDESSIDDDVSTPNERDNPSVRFFITSSPTRKENKLHLPTRKDQKLATMIIAIVVSSTVCYLPIMLTRVLYGEYKSDPIMNVLAHLLVYSSAFISPIIYVIMSSEYRQAYTCLFEDIKIKIKKCFERE